MRTFFAQKSMICTYADDDVKLVKLLKKHLTKLKKYSIYLYVRKTLAISVDSIIDINNRRGKFGHK